MKCPDFHHPAAVSAAFFSMNMPAFSGFSPEVTSRQEIGHPPNGGRESAAARI
jgi:hypothetical protein